jgi:simple sugar transport system substrate-binding protein
MQIKRGKRKMKKLYVVLAVMGIIGLLLSGCPRSRVDYYAQLSEITTGIRVEDILRRVMPVQMEDGVVKVAVIRNLSYGDHTRLFLSGCILEGIALGFQVDTFITDGDNEKCKEFIAYAIAAGYDGIILSHGGAYTYDALLPAVERGIKIVTFDSLPYRDGNINNEILAGVTSTAQEDYQLAELSLDAIVRHFPASRQPIRVIRTWMGPGVLPLDIRKTVFDRYAAEGKIREVALVAPDDHSNPRRGSKAAMLEILQQFPVGTVDAIWGSYDELAKGCLDALLEEGRRDIVIMSIDISDNDMDLMRANPLIWVSTAAVDPKLIGIVNMRLLAMKFAGEPTPDTYLLEARLVEASVLDSSINMTNIARVVDGWGSERGVFDNFTWMDELKAITLRY